VCVCVCVFQKFLDRFCGELVSVCESYLSGVILKEKGAININEDLLVQTLYQGDKSHFFSLRPTYHINKFFAAKQ